MQIQEILDISLRSLDRGKFQIPDLKTDLCRICHHHLNDLQMRALLADNALLSDFLTSRLELRLDQCNHLAARA